MSNDNPSVCDKKVLNVKSFKVIPVQNVSSTERPQVLEDVYEKLSLYKKTIAMKTSRSICDDFWASLRQNTDILLPFLKNTVTNDATMKHQMKGRSNQISQDKVEKRTITAPFGLIYGIYLKYFRSVLQLQVRKVSSNDIHSNPILCNLIPYSMNIHIAWLAVSATGAFVIQVWRDIFFASTKTNTVFKLSSGAYSVSATSHLYPWTAAH